MAASVTILAQASSFAVPGMFLYSYRAILIAILLMVVSFHPKMWKDVSADETVRAVAAMLEPVMRQVCHGGGFHYESMDRLYFILVYIFFVFVSMILSICEIANCFGIC